MISDVFTLGPGTSTGEVLACMRERAISCVVVTEGRRPTGIFTERDAVRLLADGEEHASRPISEFMTRPVVTARADLDFHGAYQLLNEGGFRHLAIVAATGELEGLVSETDFLQFTGILARSRSVGSVMKRHVFTLTPDRPLMEAVRLLSEQNIGSVVVVSDARPIGILTERDMVAFSARHTALEAPVGELMSHPLQTVSADTSLQEAGSLMRQGHIRRLVVVDEQGALAGILTRRDLVKALEGRFVALLKETIEKQHSALMDAHDQLHVAERQLLYVNLMDQIVDSAIVVDARTGRNVAANPQAWISRGYSRDEFLALEFRELAATPTDRKHWNAEAAEIMRGGNAMRELEHRRKDGSSFPVEVSLRHVRSEGRDLLVAVARDVSERKGAESSYRDLFNSVTEAIFILGEDRGILDANPAATAMYGHTRAELVGHTLEFLSAPDQNDFGLLDEQIRGAFEGQPGHFEFWGRRRNGDLFLKEVSISPGSYFGRPAAVAVARDMTERRRAEETLRQAAAVYESTAEAVVITSPDFRIVAVNKAFTSITGYSETEVRGRMPRFSGPKRDREEFFESLREQLRGHGSWQGEIWNRRKNGEVFPEWLTISVVHDPAGQVANYVAVFSDITLIKNSEAQLERLAHYDPLTDLPNRLLMQSRLEHAVDKARRSGKQVAVLFLDLDRFKNVNDSLGHPAGDELLMGIARRVRKRIREEDTVARQGGDEFIVLLESIESRQEAAQVAEQIIELLAKPFMLSGGQEVYTGASIGISLFPEDGEQATQLVRNADAAMYQAKDAGGNTWRFYTGALTRAAHARLSLETRLRRALERDEFRLCFQPQVELASGRLVGAEALIRWQSAEEGLILPAQFIPAAEETGLIVPVGHWVMEAACDAARKWRESGLPPLPIAINLSLRQLRDNDPAGALSRAMDRTGTPASQLEIEITESTMMEQGPHTGAILRRFKDLGVSLAIDDFGTGYSSLAALKQMVLDKLKIDRSFVQDIPQSGSDMRIAATIIAMAHTLGLKVLAEGVETEAQLQFLRTHRCNEGQGYFWSRPIPAADFAQWALDYGNTLSHPGD